MNNKRIGGLFAGAAAGLVASLAVMAATPTPTAACTAKARQAQIEMENLLAQGKPATDLQFKQWAEKGAAASRCSAPTLAGVWTAGVLSFAGAAVGFAVAGRKKPQGPTPGA